MEKISVTQPQQFILKNVRVDLERNEYIIYNPKAKTKTSLNLTPEQAERIRFIFCLTPISPIDVLKMKLNEFKELES